MSASRHVSKEGVQRIEQYTMTHHDTTAPSLARDALYTQFARCSPPRSVDGVRTVRRLLRFELDKLSVLAFRLAPLMQLTQLESRPKKSGHPQHLDSIFEITESITAHSRPAWNRRWTNLSFSRSRPKPLEPKSVLSWLATARNVANHSQKRPIQRKEQIKANRQEPEVAQQTFKELTAKAQAEGAEGLETTWLQGRALLRAKHLTKHLQFGEDRNPAAQYQRINQRFGPTRHS